MTVGQDSFQGDPGISGFWDAVSSAPAVVLLLDYDGTLAPFHEDRMAAVPAPGVVPALKDIDASGHTQVVIVSGRPVNEVRILLADPDLTIIGTHGYELRQRGGETTTRVISDRQSMLLDRAFACAIETIGPERVERKSATTAAHFRGMAELEMINARTSIIGSWKEFGDPSVVEIREFNGGLEMRALGSNKGTAVEALVTGLPGQPLAVYIGDDETDEDAFRIVNSLGGYAIRVGQEIRPTAASGKLATAESVVHFLERWVTERGKP